jgi:transcriptional regulator with XRE-family HTH domain
MERKFSPARLLGRRRALGLTQRELADLASLSTVSVSNMENGKKEPRARTLASLARALRCSVDYFFS